LNAILIIIGQQWLRENVRIEDTNRFVSLFEAFAKFKTLAFALQQKLPYEDSA
jgi:hypothetical protein